MNTSSKQKLDRTTALHHAGLCTTFMWQDETEEGQLDADGGVEADYASIIGTLPEEVNGSPIFVVFVQGTAVSTFGYSYPIERTVTVRLQENGEPIVAEANETEIAACEQHTRDLACKEYGKLMQIVESGAYSEGDHGECFYPDRENGTDINASILDLESAALDEGLCFAKQSDGTYQLKPAPNDVLAAYHKAKEEAEEAEDEEEDE